MQENFKKVKALISFCFIAIFILLIASVFLIIYINSAKKEIKNQQQQINTLKEQIQYYKNPPSNNDQIIQPED